MVKKCKCGKDAVFERKYEGTQFCKACFLKSIEKKIKRTIRKDRLIKPGDRIAVAFSGGKNSFLVLHVLNEIIRPRKDMELMAITIDPGTQGSPEAVKTARQICKDMGIKHHVFSFKRAFKRGLDEQNSVLRERLPNATKEDVCSSCSVAKRWMLNKEARALKATKLCTGTALDDEVQSIFMNYVRGDLTKATRMSPDPVQKHSLFVPRIKPLREIPEEEIALYSKFSGFMPYRCQCPYSGGIRSEVSDFLNKLERQHPGMKFSILETFDRLLPHVKQAQIKKGSPKTITCKSCGEPSSMSPCNLCELWK
jgi:uncharacterized protein (TIGR00269 family)